MDDILRNESLGVWRKRCDMMTGTLYVVCAHLRGKESKEAWALRRDISRLRQEMETWDRRKPAYRARLLDLCERFGQTVMWRMQYVVGCTSTQLHRWVSEHEPSE